MMHFTPVLSPALLAAIKVHNAAVAVMCNSTPGTPEHAAATHDYMVTSELVCRLQRDEHHQPDPLEMPGHRDR